MSNDSTLRIAVFRALSLGDMLCATPAIRALRYRYPEAEITLVGLARSRHFQARLPAYIDDFIAFPGYPGLPEVQAEPKTVDNFFSTMRSRQFDYAIQMHGCGPVSNEVVAKFAAAHAVGLGRGEPRDAIRLAPYPDDAHEIHRNLAAVRLLGVEPAGDEMEFPLLHADRQELAAYPKLHALLPHPYVCLHPGASTSAKRWPPAHFERVGDALASAGWRVVITGSAAEHHIAQDVARHMRYPTVIAACDISIGGLAALLAGAALIVSNDTGAAHLASALGVPSVVIFFATDPKRWAPLDETRHRAVYGEDGVEVTPVLNEAFELLSLPTAGHARGRPSG